MPWMVNSQLAYTPNSQLLDNSLRQAKRQWGTSLCQLHEMNFNWQGRPEDEGVTERGIGCVRLYCSLLLPIRIPAVVFHR